MSSLCDRVLAYLTERANSWVDARELLSVGGFGGWRTRISNLRKPPYNLTIENKTERVDGFTKSYYRLVTK